MDSRAAFAVREGCPSRPMALFDFVVEYLAQKNNHLRRGIVYCAALYVLSGLTGCARGPNVLTSEVRQGIKCVIVSDEIGVPDTIHLPEQSTGNLVLDGMRQAHVDGVSTAKIRNLLDYRDFISKTVYRTFIAEVEKKGTFQCLAKGASVKAEGVFVIEVDDLRLDHKKWASFKPNLVPTITITVMLIGNPPVELVRSRSGQINPVNPQQHPILYYKTTSSNRREDNVPAYRLTDFETNKNTFISTYPIAIENALKELMRDW